MKKDRYTYDANEDLAIFEFESHGPKGPIKKIVNYFEIGTWVDGMPIYNVAFGDWDLSSHALDDSTISNNADSQKILVTVAHTIIDFMDKMGDVAVCAQGSTPARTRLYQMGINANIEEIALLFDVYGYADRSWSRFKSGKNYSAFLVTRKKN